MHLNQRSALAALWKEEERAGITGWDFSALDGRWASQPLKWDYRGILLSQLGPADRLLDMGTGGGEFLRALNHPFSLTAVTEGYLPNVELCRKTLQPLGVEVAQVCEDDLLPFEDARFDVIANRHESFCAQEVFRVLAPGGRFVTQQVGGTNNTGLSRRLIPGFAPAYPDHNLKNCRARLADLGFEVLACGEAFPTLRFFDVGALVRFAAIIPWEFPGFGVESCFDALMDCQREIDRAGFIQSTEHRFYIAAQKPGLGD